MAKSYRNQMTPGMKMCIDYMKGKKVKKEEPNIKDVPPAYTRPKLKK
tara:strand:+ start:528 stop:668 length:141 start_codon:yes stop_codon:yes gene_type:complete